MGKKIGRPEIPKSQQRGKLLSARFRPDEIRAIQKAVRKSGKNQSEFIRTTLLEKAGVI